MRVKNSKVTKNEDKLVYIILQLTTVTPTSIVPVVKVKEENMCQNNVQVIRYGMNLRRTESINTI